MEITIEKELLLPDTQVKDAALVFKALDHDVRQKMLQLIASKGSMTVTEIYVLMELPQSMVSQHLALLRETGCVTTKRYGKFIHYKINALKINSVQRVARSIIAAQV